MNKKRYRKEQPLMPVDSPGIGAKYHVCWAYSHGVIGICVAINEEAKTVTLKKPKTGELFKNPVKFSDLRHTRTMQTKIKLKNNRG